MFNSVLVDQIINDFWFDIICYFSYVDVWVEVDDGVLCFIVLCECVFVMIGYIFLLWIIGVLILLIVVLVVFICNQVKFICCLVDVAE